MRTTSTTDDDVNDGDNSKYAEAEDVDDDGPRQALHERGITMMSADQRRWIR